MRFVGRDSELATSLLIGTFSVGAVTGAALMDNVSADTLLNFSLPIIAI